MLVTSACNSNCMHCFRSKEKNTFLISREKLIEIVDYAVENNCLELSFSGGEFFTHPYAYGLIEYCLSKKIHISILTNALEVDVPYFEKIDAGEYISFQVSIDGMEELHDMRRGKGAFDRTISNVKALFNLGYKLSAKTVLDEYNYKDIIHIVELPWFSDFLVLPVAVFDSAHEVILSPEIHEEYEKTIQLIYRKITLLNPNAPTCRCFPKEIAIKYDGNVYPCTEAREHNEYVMGNITDTPLYKVIDSYELNEFNKLVCKELLPNQCTTCISSDICNKGCRLRAKHFFGDFNAPDPFNCRIFNDEFSDTPIGKLFWGNK